MEKSPAEGGKIIVDIYQFLQNLLPLAGFVSTTKPADS